ncbi:hypothetical protein SAMN04488029_2115 [Reichenbachiella faecimaris]|uniref:Uncharacterized protein n=1 Tax=Reichenbachiella faecimaris TaxID=692418 RepID=A0A1W2GEH0_REIFA|nr:hypothetical protein [Reichenbachiella faecimaris]SMD34646.1 hypothetical protein SAMN04488029_2115 [Reichenbachiella faecimaris]
MGTVISTVVYRLKKESTDPITLSVTIGQGQQAASTIHLNHVMFKSELANDFEEHVGDNTSLLKSILTLDTDILDVNPSTDETELTVRLEGGEKDVTKKFTETADHSGGVVHYHITFYLK